MDQQIRRGIIQEMIVVMPNANHSLGGSWYHNSPLTGNWEDYVVQDVVAYVDHHFDTLATAAARAVAGHGMGGLGALEIALKHPDVFQTVYALSPAVFAEGGLEEARLLTPEFLRSWEANRQQWDASDETTRRHRFRDHVQSRLNSFNSKRSWEGLAISCGAAFSSDVHAAFPWIDFSSAARSRLENGFGHWREKLNHYVAGEGHLRSITIECAAGEELGWIRRGAEAVSQGMTSLGITNRFVVHPGTHESGLGLRLKDALLPAVSEAFSQAGRDGR